MTDRAQQEREYQQKWVETYESLFLHPGWRQLQEDFKGFQGELRDKWQTYKSHDAYRYECGRNDAFDQLLNYENTVKYVRESLSNATQEQDAQDF